MSTATKAEQLTCPCGTTGDGEGWLNETWPTLGGGKLHVVSCPSCRRLAVPFEGDDRCDGRCGGHLNCDLAAVADCITCQDSYAEDVMVAQEEGNEPGPPDRQNSWSCWSEGCVRAWASTHPHCDVEVTLARAVA